MLDTRMKVLVVDDFSTMRRILKNILKQLGYENIAEAEDGIKAYEAMKDDGIGLVITDWNMPNMDGLEFMKKARNDPDLKDTPFLMVTAEAEKHKVVAAIQAGVDNYIVKPFTAEVLREKLEKIFQKRGT